MDINSYLKMVKHISSQVTIPDKVLATFISMGESKGSSVFEEQQANIARSAIEEVTRKYVFQRLLSSEDQVWLTLKSIRLEKLFETNNIDLNEFIAAVFERKLTAYLERTDIQLITY